MSPQLWITAAGQSQPSIDLAKNNYFILLASGAMSGSSITQHSSRFASPASFNFKAIGLDLEAAGNESWYKAHGCLMCLAWLAMAPTGMIFAQFYQGPTL